MNDESDVRTWLATADVPDLRPLDFDGTVTIGRTRARRRRTGRIAGTAAVGLAAVLAVPGVLLLAKGDRTTTSPDGPAASQVSGSTAERNPNSCGHQLLKLPDDPAFKALGETTAMVAAADPTGRWAAGGTAAKTDADAGKRLLVLWENGRARALPPETQGGVIVAVNSQGQVLAKGGNNQYGAAGAWVYRNGSITRIPVPAGAQGYDFHGINEAGDVLGYAVYHDGGPEANSRMAIWRAGDLTKPQFLSNTAFFDRFSSDGKVLGSTRPGFKPYVWTGGRGTTLTGPGEAAQATLLDANGDWAIGKTITSGTIYRWKVSTGEVNTVAMPNLADVWLSMAKVRQDGTVVAAGDNGGKLLLVNGDRSKELHVPSGFDAETTSVNLDGTVVYGGFVKAPDNRFPVAAMWTC
jgi:hypothetical protein